MTLEHRKLAPSDLEFLGRIKKHLLDYKMSQWRLLSTKDLVTNETTKKGVFFLRVCHLLYAQGCHMTLPLTMPASKIKINIYLLTEDGKFSIEESQPIYSGVQVDCLLL